MAPTSSGHCSLCVDSLIHPKDDTRKPVLIFLTSIDCVLKENDLDTVELVAETFSKIPPDKGSSDLRWVMAHSKHLHPYAVKHLELLIQRIEKSGQRALLILCSSQRKKATLEQFRNQVFSQYEFSKYLCGKTCPETWNHSPDRKAFAHSLNCKADVIQHWMLTHQLDSADFIVLGLSSSERSERFGDRCIEVSYLLGKEHTEMACSVLGISSMVC